VDQSDESKSDRRGFFSLAFRRLGYAAPAVVALGVPAMLADEAEGAETQMGGMGMMRMMRMKMMMMMKMM
jgi:hypothetical protein